ncbi:uncharacterized protein LOC133326645 [Musca vetustissima]|uniref:uncharacterized protein LOC133326645 n=1 Tax=Musca vetustissima TaxID=27455 RepID=UPI002AB62FE2|nr:uncharacterized protein LOC133326645 [Musca vetustissima]
MPVKSSKATLYKLLFLFLVISAVDLGLAVPTKVVKDDPIKESLEELNDLNESSILRDSSSMTSQPYSHRDEDMLTDPKLTTVFANYKYDVEILESGEDKSSELAELEERYHGPAIVINTDEFINENIEMNAADEEERADKKALATSHLILSIILVVLALVSIALYTAVVIWRNHIEQRYGMRELLVTNDNQDYWPQHMTDTAAAVPQQATQQNLPPSVPHHPRQQPQHQSA